LYRPWQVTWPYVACFYTSYPGIQVLLKMSLYSWVHKTRSGILCYSVVGRKFSIKKPWLNYRLQGKNYFKIEKNEASNTFYTYGALLIYVRIARSKNTLFPVMEIDSVKMFERQWLSKWASVWFCVWVLGKDKLVHKFERILKTL
jgi:hypothetical protein